MEGAKKLSNLQLELLRMFHYDLGDEQLSEIKNLLAQYFADKLTSEIDSLFEANNWGDEKIEEWGNEHMRTKYDQ